MFTPIYDGPLARVEFTRNFSRHRLTPEAAGGFKVKRVLAVLLVLISSVATADVTVAEYRQAKSTGGYAWKSVKAYVEGLGTGMLTANVVFKVEHETQLFCPPMKLSLEQNNYLQILEQEIVEAKPSDSEMINLVLIAG